LPDGTFLLENKKLQNVTYVNGQAVVSKGGITERDRIELGADHYLFDWALLKSSLPKMEDIRPLKRIYDEYLAANQCDQDELEELKTKMDNLGLYGSLTGIFTMSALALNYILGGGHKWYLLFYIIPIAITLYIFTKRKKFKNLSETLKRQNKENQIRRTLQFHQEFVCSNTHRYFSTSYDLLTQHEKCPYCGAIFIK
jgi:hypothetical protein